MPESLNAIWESCDEMESVTLHIFDYGDPAGTVAAGNGFAGGAGFPSPNEPPERYTAVWVGTTVPQEAIVSEP